MKILISIALNTNDNPRIDFGVLAIQYLIPIHVILIPVSFSFIVMYFVVLVIIITKCLARQYDELVIPRVRVGVTILL
jgi:hypothetical protein